MKFRTSILCMALVTSTLLLSSTSCLRKHKDGRTVASLSIRPAVVTNAEKPTLRGSYTLIDPAGATATIKKAIETSVKNMSWLTRGTARDRLTETNLPPPNQIDIDFTSSEVSIKTDQGLIKTPADGRPVKWKKYNVSTKWDGAYLKRTFRGNGGERVNTYDLGGDGTTLTMYVYGKSTGRISLSEPLKYQLVYRRK